ncbi:MAG: bifunctional oligoribonuclease/PAP phosphatase NrnA [Planctomycetes bacterium]|jgi:phosphoesterase RecJ-like protein|nr:bifunctional oligoribonuclease/PAP phosphatase NrnA [Planctomycetota bacterium]
MGMEQDVYRQAVALLGNARNILVTTHTRPDGDACGCVVAATAVLRALGKRVHPLLLSPLPDWYAFLFGEKVPVLGSDVQGADLAAGRFGPIDLVLIVDTSSYNQLPGLEDFLRQGDRPILVIDHHVTSDRIGRLELVDQTAAAAGLVLFDFLRAAGWPIPRPASEGLFVAIATDTGWFHLRNADARVFRACAELIEQGVDPNGLYQKLYQDFSFARFRLLVALLNTIELHFDGRYASQYLRQADFERTGAAHRDTENLINECQRIGSVSVAALFAELKDGRIRCSLRSRPNARRGGEAVDVNEIARQFGGGGHKMAAGTYLPAPLKHAMQLIYDEVAKRLR